MLDYFILVLPIPQCCNLELWPIVNGMVAHHLPCAMAMDSNLCSSRSRQVRSDG